MSETKGIIFIATNEEGVKEAIFAAKSVRKYCGDISMTLFTNFTEIVEEGYFEFVIKVERKGTGNLKTYDKVLHLKDTPYDRTIFMDTDTYVLNDIRDVYAILDKFDFAIAHAPMRNVTPENSHFVKMGGKGNDPIPRTFPLLQSGVILYKKNEKVWRTLQEFVDTYERNQYYFDQPSLREVLWLNKNDIKLWILPPEYNFTKIEMLKLWKDSDFKQAIPKIFHYTSHRGQHIAQLIANILDEKADDQVGKFSFIKKMVKEKIKQPLKQFKIIK